MTPECSYLVSGYPPIWRPSQWFGETSLRRRAGRSVRLGHAVSTAGPRSVLRADPLGLSIGMTTEANGQQSSDSTAQYPANDYARDDVSDAVCLRPQVTDDPAAQLQAHDDHDEFAPGPPVTQPPKALPPTVPSAGTGFRSGREGVGWHVSGDTIASGAASRSGNR